MFPSFSLCTFQKQVSHNHKHLLTNSNSNFWHQKLRKLFTGNAHTVAHTILRLPAHNIIARYLKLTLIFLQSGIYHIPLDLASDISLSESGAVRFFVMQAFGIMIEDFVQAVFRKVTGRKRKAESEKWMKIVGFVWTAWFLLFWTSPGWYFVMIRSRATEAADRRMLPFSVASRLFK